MEPTGCSETPVNKYNTLSNNSKTRINHSDHGQGLKSGNLQHYLAKIKT
jgi:hypothetical protein